MATKKKAAKRVGRLLVIGGAEDPDESVMTILPRFVKMCGGRRARIVVCGSPSEDPKGKERKYDRVFEKLGVKNVYNAGVLDRPDAERQELLDAVDRATGIFFTGGDQLRLTSVISGTTFDDRVRERLWKNGLIVAGTSAGAAAMSSTMIIGGRENGSVRRTDVDLAPGLGFWRDAFIDTHFAQRGRLSRVLAVVAQNPQIIGIGIDENTAVDVVPGRAFTVVGAGAVFVFDGRITHADAADRSDEEISAVTDVLVHVLPEGFSFDLKKKRPVSEKGKVIPARSR